MKKKEVIEGLDLFQRNIKDKLWKILIKDTEPRFGGLFFMQYLIANSEKEAKTTAEELYGIGTIVVKSKLDFSQAIQLIEGMPSEEELETFLEKYKFPIMTETDDYGDSIEITRKGLAIAIYNFRRGRWKNQRHF